MTENEHAIDDLLSDDPAESSPVDPSYLDSDLDLGDMETELTLDRSKPLEIIVNPITASTICTANVQDVVSAFLSLQSLNQSLKVFENELRKAALVLATGTTKTRRLSAEIDGEIQTIQVLLPDDEWPERDLGVLAAWCNRKESPDILKKFYQRFVREKVETKRSPIKKEIKKLQGETFPEGSVLAEAKEKLLRVNKGSSHRLPRLVIEGDKLNSYEQKRFGDGEDEE